MVVILGEMFVTLTLVGGVIGIILITVRLAKEEKEGR